jgi:hypothetical protein
MMTLQVFTQHKAIARNDESDRSMEMNLHDKL